jgi:hypothetical protein
MAVLDYSRFRDATELNWYESDWTMRPARVG